MAMVGKRRAGCGRITSGTPRPRQTDDFLLYASASALAGTVHFSTLSPLAGTLATLGTFAAAVSVGCALALPETAHRNLADMLKARTGG